MTALHSIQITVMVANAALIACHSTSKAIHAPEINKAHSRYAIANSITPILTGTFAFAIMRGILARTR